MVALKGKAITNFLKAPDADIHAVLIYGPGAGLVRERSDMLARQVVSDFKDPFNFLELTEAELKAEPSRLVDEAASLSMMGGRRVVRARITGEAGAAALKNLIAALDGETVQSNALVLIEGGDLTKRSTARKLFEAARYAAALPCYEDTARDVRDLALDVFKQEGLTAEPAALDLITARLGEDRGVTRSEIDKIILYVGPNGVEGRRANQVTADDVAVCLGGEGASEYSALAHAVADGDATRAEKELFRARQANASPIMLLRSMTRYFDRLTEARAAADSGIDAGSAMKKLRPPVFFAEAKIFEAQLRRWRLKELKTALSWLFEAERAAKRTGAPQTELAERTALRVSRLAPRR